MTTRTPAVRLDENLVLQRYLLTRLDLAGIEEARQLLGARDLEGSTADGASRFLEELLLRKTALQTSEPKLRLYDENVQRHTQQVNAKRQPAVTWKYFQWLTLMACEIYLDEALGDARGLVERLNAEVEELRGEQGLSLAKYVEEDLPKLAVWLATGSGKTLIMHINILQYRHYLRLHANEAPDRVVVLTPNEGLSDQHSRELARSGFEVRRFDRERLGLFLDADAVDVIDIHKLRDEPGEKTVAIEAFSGRNLVLVDEGHRGATGSDWRERRARLVDTGFSFEYSATFAQAVGTESSGALFTDYAKSIVLDYSYRYFHADGFGKDFRILNLPGEAVTEDVRTAYLTGCLLTFLQQLLLYEESPGDVNRFQIEKPLWVFVGSSVGKSTRERTDVVEILRFINAFTSDRSSAEAVLGRLTSGQVEVTSTTGANVFENAFAYLAARGLSAGQLYTLALTRVFNAGAPAAIRLSVLKGTDGELAISVGGNKPFGVISVGDAADLVKAVQADGEIIVDEAHLAGSMFGRIDDARSDVQLLVGARKFIEGWNSWRVSTLGLLNVGRTEGAQVIQLFGRGVRLKGEGFSLMRSRAAGAARRPPHLDLLETLAVFGVRADYVRQFRDLLRAEGVQVEQPLVFDLPTTIRDPFPTGLLQPKVEGGKTFVEHGPPTALTLSGDRRVFVELDWYPRVAAVDSSAFAALAKADKSRVKVPQRVLGLLDREALFSELVKYKRGRGYNNLIVTRDAVDALLESSDWYDVLAPPATFKGGLERRRAWAELVASLLRRYVDRYYKIARDGWELTRLALESLDTTSPNMIDAWRVSVEAGEADVLLRLQKYAEDGQPFDLDRAAVLNFDEHLYRPVVYANKSKVKASPVALNRGEKDFLLDLAALCRSNEDWLVDREVFVLRNLSRGKGIGFFEANNFYPDFLVWVIEPDHTQRLTFVDPKGLTHLGKDDPKIRFHEVIREIEQRLGEPKLILNSFILSNTRLQDINWREDGWTGARFADELHVLFQDEPDYVQDLLRRVLASTAVAPTAPRELGRDGPIPAVAGLRRARTP